MNNMLPIPSDKYREVKNQRKVSETSCFPHRYLYTPPRLLLAVRTVFNAS